MNYVAMNWFYVISIHVFIFIITVNTSVSYNSTLNVKYYTSALYKIVLQIKLTIVYDITFKKYWSDESLIWVFCMHFKF